MIAGDKSTLKKIFSQNALDSKSQLWYANLGKVGEHIMNNTSRAFSGRTFSPEDIELIKWTRKTYPGLARNELAGTVCELLEWTTPSGRAKIIQCLDFLSILEKEGVVELPPIGAYTKRGKREMPKIEFKTDEVTGDLAEYMPIRLTIARVGDSLRRWRSYVEQYHMLGDKTVFGSRLQYFVKSDETELGCIQFSAAAWALEERDRFIGWSVADRKARLNLIVNNSRYLIFPWVRIKNLASHALSLAAKQIQSDWLREYCYAPVLMETFVDLEHFQGICYKAANWIPMGETKGRGRMDRNYDYGVSKKAVFVYPLQKDFKAVLCGEKPCKVVNPDE